MLLIIFERTVMFMRDRPKCKLRGDLPMDIPSRMEEDNLEAEPAPRHPGDHDIFAIRHRISPKMINVHLQYVHRTPSLLHVSRCTVFACLIRRKQTARPFFWPR
jgi:hypothetical protein